MTFRLVLKIFILWVSLMSLQWMEAILFSLPLLALFSHLRALGAHHHQTTNPHQIKRRSN